MAQATAQAEGSRGRGLKVRGRGLGQGTVGLRTEVATDRPRVSGEGRGQRELRAGPGVLTPGPARARSLVRRC